MDEATTISRSTQIRGKIKGESDLIVHGYVEGEISVDGDVVIEAEGLVSANITARNITIRGSVRGDLRASQVLALESGARVVGDLFAERLSVGEGALVRGSVLVGDVEPLQASNQTKQVARSPIANRAPAPPAARPVAPRPVERAAPVRPAMAPTRAQVPAPSVVAAHATPAAPPPPVVPALKKGTRGTVKKKG